MSQREEFEAVRERTIEALENDDLVSLYAGLIHETGENAYYFANDVDDDELQEVAATQLGIITRVLADKSDLDVDDVADLARERAEDMDLRP